MDATLCRLPLALALAIPLQTMAQPAEDPEGWFATIEDAAKDVQEVYIIDGQSMAPKLEPGDRVGVRTVSTATEVPPNAVVVAEDDGGAVYVKRLASHSGTQIVLRSENREDYPDII